MPPQHQVHFLMENAYTSVWHNQETAVTSSFLLSLSLFCSHSHPSPNPIPLSPSSTLLEAFVFLLVTPGKDYMPICPSVFTFPKASSVFGFLPVSAFLIPFLCQLINKACDFPLNEFSNWPTLISCSAKLFSISFHKPLLITC